MKKILAITLSLCCLATLLTACSSEQPEESITQPNQTQVQDTKETIKEATSLQAIKIGTIDHEISIREMGDNGIIYNDIHNKYGFMSYDLKFDSGAIYEDVKTIGPLFMAATKKAQLNDDVNVYKLFTKEGKEINKELYAYCRTLNDRYIMTFKAAKPTNSFNEACVFFTEGGDFLDTNFAMEEKNMYTGKWTVYDTVELRELNVFGNSNVEIEKKGQYATISYIDKDGNKVTIQPTGEPEPDNFYNNVLNNGYIMKTELKDEMQVTNLYNTNNELILTKSDSCSFSVPDDKSDYIVCKDQGKLTIYNLKGELVSSEFEVNSDAHIYDGYVVYNNTVYTFQGTVVTKNDVAVRYIHVNPLNHKYALIELIDGDCLVFYNNKQIGKFKVGYNNITDCNDFGTVSVDDNFYCYKDNQYSLQNAKGVGYGIVIKDNALIDAFTGTQIINGYNDAIASEAKSGYEYVCALNADRLYDLYFVHP